MTIDWEAFRWIALLLMQGCLFLYFFLDKNASSRSRVKGFIFGVGVTFTVLISLLRSSDKSKYALFFLGLALIITTILISQRKNVTPRYASLRIGAVIAACFLYLLGLFMLLRLWWTGT